MLISSPLRNKVQTINVCVCVCVCVCARCRALACLLDRDRSGVDTLRKGHSTALHIAATNDYVECVRLLVINVSVCVCVCV